MQGCYTAIITPFLDGKVDFSSLGRLIDTQMQAGLSGIVPCGTTGESPTLTHEEHREVIKFAIDKVKKFNQQNQTQIKVIAGAGSNSTAEAVDLVKDSEDLGADAVMIVSPYYNKPTQEGLYQHFKKISESTSLEIVVYNIPGRSSISINLDTMLRICQLPNVNTIKEATGNIDYTGDVLSHKENIDVLSGNDSMNLPIYSLGGKGCISVLSNVFPKKVKAVYDCYQQGKVLEAQKLHLQLWSLNQALFMESNPIPIKYACLLAGLITSDELRLPLVAVSPTLSDKLKQLIDRLAN